MDSGIKVMVSLQMPDKKQENTQTVEDRVRHSLDLIDSGYSSEIEWKLVCRLLNDLYAMGNRTPRVQNLIDMIEPIMSKYGHHGVSGEPYKKDPNK